MHQRCTYISAWTLVRRISCGSALRRGTLQLVHNEELFGGSLEYPITAK